MSKKSHMVLSPFQREKLAFFFKFYEPNERNELDNSSLGNFMKRVLEFTGWKADSADATKLHEIHENFFEVLFDKTSEVKGSDDIPERTVTLDDWLSVWSNLLLGCMGSMNFPVWLRLLPQCLFQMMDRDRDNYLNEEELFNFYHYMVKLPREEAAANSHNAWSQMTDLGNYPLKLESYEQIFSNFLLGRTPYGPGRHIFGCFEHSLSMNPFTLIQPAVVEDDVDMDVKIYMQKRPKRMSVTGL